MIDVLHPSPVVTEDLLCPSILVSGAGTSDGFYKIAADQRAAWAPGRQIYERIDGDRSVLLQIDSNNTNNKFALLWGEAQLCLPGFDYKKRKQFNS